MKDRLGSEDVIWDLTSLYQDTGDDNIKKDIENIKGMRKRAHSSKGSMHQIFLNFYCNMSLYSRSKGDKNVV